MKNLLESIVNRPKQYLLLSLIGIVVLSLGIGKLEENYSYKNWFNDQDPILISEQKFEQEFGSLESLSILLTFKESIFSPEILARIGIVTDELTKLIYSIRVDSLVNTSVIYAIQDDIFIEDLVPDYENVEDIPYIRKRAYADPFISTNLLFEAEKSTVISFRFKKSPKVRGEYGLIIADLDKILKKEMSGIDVEMRFIGNAKISDTFAKSALKDFSILIPVLLLLVGLLIYLQFRSFKVVGLSFLSIIFANTSMLGIAGYVGITLNNLTSVAPELILAIGLADAVHILAVYAIQLKQDKTSKQALLYSLNKNLLPTIITSLTTSIGFISFVTSEMDNVVGMGIISAVGTILAWFVTYFFLAPGLLLTNAKVQTKSLNLKISSKKFINFLLNNRPKVYTIYGLFILLTIYLIPKVDINSDPIKYFRGELDFSKDIFIAEKKMGGIFPLELLFDSGKVDGVKNHYFLSKVQEYIEWAESLEYFSHSHSIIKIIKQMNQVFNGDDKSKFMIPEDKNAIAQLIFTYNLSVPEGRSLTDRISFKNDKLRLTLMMKHTDSKTGDKVYASLANKAKEMGLNMELTGKRYLWHTLNHKVVTSFVKSLGLAIILVTLLIATFLKSTRLGLISIIPNLVPILSGSLFLMLLGRSLDIGSSIVASIVLGIAVDDTIHIVTNYKKYLTEGDRKNALIRLFEETAPALITTTLILSLSFSCFILASFVPNQNMGILMSMCLMMALICDLTLLPLILHDLVGGDAKELKDDTNSKNS